MIKEIILPCDGLPLEVTVLPLFSLGDVDPGIPPDFVYQVESGDGKTYDIVYPLEARLKDPPSEPVDGDKWAVIEWDRFQAALTHRQMQLKCKREYELNCANKILTECVAKSDRERIVTEAGYAEVYRAALCPEVSWEDLEAQLRAFF